MQSPYNGSVHSTSSLVSGTYIPTAAELRKFQQHHANTADTRTIQAFLRATAALTALASFRTMHAADRAERHCVRCHGPYTEAANTPGSCFVPHLFSAEGCRAGATGYDEVYAYGAVCCGGATVEEEGEGSMNWIREPSMCFTGRHTTDVEEVEDDYNGSTIVPCDIEGGECVQVWRNETEPEFCQ